MSAIVKGACSSAGFVGQLTRACRCRLRSALAREAADSGSALVEFIFMSVVLLVPVFYLVMMLARLQAGAYAVTGAAREAGRAYVTAAEAGQASARARAAADLAYADQGFRGQGGISLSCDGSPCLRRDGRVTVTATVSVPLPLVPTFVASAVPTSVPLSATHVATVDRFGAR